MGGLSSLASLSAIGNNSTVQTPSTTTTPAAAPADTSSSSTSTSMLGSLLGLATGTTPLTQVVIILLGLLLIAAGIFGFDKTRELITTGTKSAAAIA